MKFKMKMFIPLVSLGLGIFWIYYGLSNYGFWHPVKGPVMGFVPTLIASVLVLLSILGLIKSFKEKDEADRPENWLIVLVACIVFSMVFIFGMLFSLMAFVFVWLKLYEKVNWKNTVIVLLISFAIIYGVFIRWLRVPFPNGIIINAILG